MNDVTPTRICPLPRLSAAAVPALSRPLTRCVATPVDVLEPDEARRPASRHIDGKTYRALHLGCLQPGDILFTYKPGPKSWLQLLIAAGGLGVNVCRPASRGNKNVSHTSLVIEAFAATQQLHVADAVIGHGRRRLLRKCVGISLVGLNFSAPENADDPSACYLVYRCLDPRLGPCMVELASRWAKEGTPTFGHRLAFFSPLVSKRLGPHAKARLAHVTTHLQDAAPVPAMHGRGYFKVMCSEFVAYLGAVASMALYCEDHPKSRPLPLSWRGLRHGPGGEAFCHDPKGAVPSALQGRIARDPHMRAVGYLPPAAELQAYCGSGLMRN